MEEIKKLEQEYEKTKVLLQARVLVVKNYLANIQTEKEEIDKLNKTLTELRQKYQELTKGETNEEDTKDESEKTEAKSED